MFFSWPLALQLQLSVVLWALALDTSTNTGNFLLVVHGKEEKKRKEKVSRSCGGVLKEDRRVLRMHALGNFLVVVRNFVGIGHGEERGGKCPIPTNRTETGRIFSKYGHLMTA